MSDDVILLGEDLSSDVVQLINAALEDLVTFQDIMKLIRKYALAVAVTLYY